MKLTKLAFAMTIALTGCTSQTEHLKSLNPEYFDKDTPVGEDFYHHVNRGWQKAHPLTDEYARYGNFNILADTAEVRVRDLVLGVSDTNPAPGSVAHKSGYYLFARHGLRAPEQRGCHSYPCRSQTH